MESKLVSSVFFFALCWNICTTKTVNNAPFIGILSQTSLPSLVKFGESYIAASYVKFVESSGARVVPILLNQTDSYYENLFNSINGVLLPGGSVTDYFNAPYSKIGRYFYQMAIKSFDEHGIPFPIWGTCLGFELLSVLTSGEKLLAFVNVLDVSLPLQFTKDFQKSRLFHEADKSIIKNLATQDITYNNHHDGLTVANFSKNAALKDFYHILSVNENCEGVTFISTMEAKRYPFYGVQYHPEKNPFEWLKTNIDHSADAIDISHFFGDFFISEARKNPNTYSDGKMIYDYAPVYTGDVCAFEQCYFFPIGTNRGTK